MIRMLDGPAMGVELTPRRAPIYVRVVQDESLGAWDVLDLPDDTPGPSETLHVYRRVEGSWSAGGGFACSRGGNQGHRCTPLGQGGEYEHVSIDGERFRGTDAWRAWCLSQPQARPTAEAFGA